MHARGGGGRLRELLERTDPAIGRVSAAVFIPPQQSEFSRDRVGQVAVICVIRNYIRNRLPYVCECMHVESAWEA